MFQRSAQENNKEGLKTECEYLQDSLQRGTTLCSCKPNTKEIVRESWPAEIEPVVDDWEDNYTGQSRQARKAKLFSYTELWNVRDRLTDGLPRTNNSLASQFPTNYRLPSVYKLIGHFRKEQDKVEIDITRSRASNRQLEASKPKYFQLNRRLCAAAET